MIACIDPGTSAKGGTGLAFFADDGTLISACLLRPPNVKDVSERIRQTLARFTANTPVVYPKLCLIEWPQIYKGDRRDPNHLLGLTGMAVALATTLGAQECRAVLPRTWKGTLDGDAMTKRIEGRLTPGELACIDPCPTSLRHNILDSVGLGLYHFGRLERKRVIRR